MYDSLHHIEASGHYADSVTVNGARFLSLQKAKQATGAKAEDILWWAATEVLPHFTAKQRLYVAETQLMTLAKRAEAIRDARRDQYGYMG